MPLIAQSNQLTGPCVVWSLVPPSLCLSFLLLSLSVPFYLGRHCTFAAWDQETATMTQKRGALWWLANETKLHSLPKDPTSMNQLSRQCHTFSLPTGVHFEAHAFQIWLTCCLTVSGWLAGWRAHSSATKVPTSGRRLKRKEKMSEWVRRLLTSAVGFGRGRLSAKPSTASDFIFLSLSIFVNCCCSCTKSTCSFRFEGTD